MHQFLSSVLSLVLSPFNWIVILLIAAWLVKKRKIKKVLLIFSLLLFIIFGNTFLLQRVANYYQPARVNVDSLSTYSCGIVPGGFASVDMDPEGYFNSSSLQLPPPYLLITSAFHVPRASIIFKKSGLAVEPFPCNYTEGMDSFSWDDLLPCPSVLLG